MIELSADQVVPLTRADGTPLTRLTVGLGWDKNPTAGFAGSGAPEIDLDATAVQFAAGTLFDIAFYNNLATRDGSVRHLGDNRSGSGAGDDESITVDLTGVYGKVDTIVFLVSSYAGHSLEFVDNAYVRVLDTDGLGGEPVEVARLTITLTIRETGVVMAKLVRDEASASSWALHAIGRGVAVTVPSRAAAALQPFL